MNTFRTRTWLNLALAAMVVTLAVLAWRAPPSEPTTQTHALSRLTLDQTKSVTIERVGQPPLELRRTPEGWRVTAPFAARADATQVDQLASILSATSTQKLARNGLEQYELDPPLAQIRFDSETFSFGGINPIDGRQYVATPDAVYLLPTRYFALVAAPPAQFATKRPLRDGARIVGFQFNGVEIERLDGVWRAAGHAQSVSQDAMNAFAQRWESIHAVASQPFAGPPPEGKRISLRLKDGSRVAFVVVSEKPDLALLRIDEQFLFHIPAASAQGLLTPPIDSPPH